MALGMALAFVYSARLGICAAEDAERVKNHLKKSGLPADVSDLDKFSSSADDLMALMMQDKKVEAGKLTLILADAIGKSRIVKDVAAEDVHSFLQEKTAL